MSQCHLLRHSLSYLEVTCSEETHDVLADNLCDTPHISLLSSRISDDVDALPVLLLTLRNNDGEETAFQDAAFETAALNYQRLPAEKSQSKHAERDAFGQGIQFSFERQSYPSPYYNSFNELTVNYTGPRRYQCHECRS